MSQSRASTSVRTSRGGLRALRASVSPSPKGDAPTFPPCYSPPMRKTFELTHPRHKPAQALDRVKHQLRKYIKRERRKELPEDVDYWDFDCRIGLDEGSAEVAHTTELSKRLDALVEQGATAAYIEILVKPGRREKRPKSPDEPTD